MRAKVPLDAGRFETNMVDTEQLELFAEAYPSLETPFEARIEICNAFWNRIEKSEQGSILIQVLKRYRECHKPAGGQDPDLVRRSFAWNELTTACYRAGVEVTQAEALTILHVAFHGCGHGQDVAPPVDLALSHFQSKPYSRDLFDALRAYRTGLGPSYTVAQVLKGRLDLILWQDLDTPLANSACWTSRIRAAVRQMEPGEQARWRALFQAMRFNFQTGLPKAWERSARSALAGVTNERFCVRMGEWLKAETEPGQPQLSGSGSHVLKNLIWYATLVDSPQLDIGLTRLTSIPWKKPELAEKLKGALKFLKERRTVKR
jgi:hypothetical protein